MPAFFEGPPAELSFCPGLCYDTRTASAKGEDGTILSAQKTDTRGTASAARRLDVVFDGKWWQWICGSTGGILIRYEVYVPEQPIPLKLK